MWVYCDVKCVRKFCDACRLVQAGPVKDSKFPLLWNCHFVSGTNYQELCEDCRYKSAVQQQTFVADRFTFHVSGIKVELDTFCNFPTINIDTNEETTLMRDTCLARIIL